MVYRMVFLWGSNLCELCNIEWAFFDSWKWKELLWVRMMLYVRLGRFIEAASGWRIKYANVRGLSSCLWVLLVSYWFIYKTGCWHLADLSCTFTNCKLHSTQWKDVKVKTDDETVFMMKRNLESDEECF